MDSTLNFAVDIDKLSNVISSISTEKNNMNEAISNIYSTLEEMGGFWEGEAYQAAKTNLESYKGSLEDSVEMIDKIISILNEDKEAGEDLKNKIWGW